jgi:hypothetical protein
MSMLAVCVHRCCENNALRFETECGSEVGILNQLKTIQSLRLSLCTQKILRPDGKQRSQNRVDDTSKLS